MVYGILLDGFDVLLFDTERPQIFGFPRLPRPGSVLDFFTLSFWVVKDNHPFIFKIFLDEIAGHCRKHPFFLVGLHEKNPLCEEINKKPHIKYRSRSYLVNWAKEKRLAEEWDDNHIPYLECGFL